MRILIWLTLIVAFIAPAHADQPERLTDIPAPKVKLVPAIGWRLSAVAMMDVDRGVVVVVIEGDVFNTSDSERQSPKIRLAVQGMNGNDIFYWTVLPDLQRVKPGDYTPFSARLESPPPDIHTVEISTVEQD